MRQSRGYRLVAVILALAVCATMPAVAVAAEKEHYVLTCIGDSMANGSCLAGIAVAPNMSPQQKLIYTNETTYRKENGEVVSLLGQKNGTRQTDYRFYLPAGITSESYEAGMLLSYPTLLAKRLNGVSAATATNFDAFYAVTGYQPMSAAALRTADVRSALDPTYSLGEDDYLWNMPISVEKRQLLAEAVESGVIENSDCVICAVGGNDIFAGPLTGMAFAMGEDEKKIPYLKNAVAKGMEDFKENLPFILEKMMERNSDCLYVLVGVHNPVHGYTIHDMAMLVGKDLSIFGRLLPIGNLGDRLVDQLNQVMIDLADQYDNVIYVDTCGTETYIDGLKNGEDMDIPVTESEGVGHEQGTVIAQNPVANGIHPTAEGHASLARKIYAAINLTENEETDTVALDVGGCGDVLYVLRNGKQVPYTFTEEGDMLLLSGSGKDIDKVRVICQNGEDLIVRRWKCTWSDNGYWTRLESEKERADKADGVFYRAWDWCLQNIG